MMESSATNILQGAGLYEAETFYGMSVSMAGGGGIYIKSYDTTFDSEPSKNSVLFETDDITGNLETFSLPPLSGKSRTGARTPPTLHHSETNQENIRALSIYLSHKY